MVRNGDIISAEGTELVVYGLSGQKVASASDSFNLSALASGIYMIEARSAEGVAVIKVIK